MGVTEITSYQQYKDLINGDKTIAIVFWAIWCASARVLALEFERMSDLPGFNETVGFYKVDVDAQEAISQEVGTRIMPTFMAFKKSLKVGEVIGPDPPALEIMLQTVATL